MRKTRTGYSSFDVFIMSGNSYSIISGTNSVMKFSFSDLISDKIEFNSSVKDEGTAWLLAVERHSSQLYWMSGLPRNHETN